MAKLTQDQIMQIASTNYTECETIISTIAQAIKKNSDPNFSAETTMACFDIILQACLFNASVADGKLEQEEMAFIGCLTRYVDLMTVVNGKIREEDKSWVDITWMDIPTLGREVQDSLAVISAGLIKDYADAFVRVFATVDKILTEVDLLAVLNEKVMSIFVAIAGVDGDDLKAEVVKEETVRAAAIYKALVVDLWREITKE